MTKTTQKSAKTASDNLFSKLIRTAGECEHCGSSNTLQCAHWISRRYSHTRTDFDNAFCLCAGCHRWFTDHPTEFSRWALGRRGEETYQRLLEASRERGKFDWIEERTRLKSMWEGVE